MLDGRDIDVQATGVRARGGFPICSRRATNPGSVFWSVSVPTMADRPGATSENLMGKALVDYLSGAIKGGQATDATLAYGGNRIFSRTSIMRAIPGHGAAQERHLAFQPDWPALTGLNIDLNFINDGLWMKADKAMLGNVTASNLDAVIPDYSREKLLIDADVNGPGKEVGPYLTRRR